jgi:hypothetical protein
MHLLYAGFNITNSSSFGEGFSHFIHDRSFIWQVLNWIPDHAKHFVEWLRQPREHILTHNRVKERSIDNTTDVLAVILAWAITFTIIMTLLSVVGFGPIGIGAGMSPLTPPTANASD